MPENVAGIIRAGRYSVNAVSSAGTNTELGEMHWPAYFGNCVMQRNVMSVAPQPDLHPKGDKRGCRADSCVPACRVR